MGRAAQRWHSALWTTRELAIPRRSALHRTAEQAGDELLLEEQETDCESHHPGAERGQQPAQLQVDEERKERREQQQKAYDDQQKFIAETKEFIERFKGTYSKTLQVQSRVKMLEKLTPITAPGRFVCCTSIGMPTGW